MSSFRWVLVSTGLQTGGWRLLFNSRRCSETRKELFAGGVIAAIYHGMASWAPSKEGVLVEVLNQHYSFKEYMNRARELAQMEKPVEAWWPEHLCQIWAWRVCTSLSPAFREGVVAKFSDYLANSVISESVRNPVSKLRWIAMKKITQCCSLALCVCSHRYKHMCTYTHKYV